MSRVFQFFRWLWNIFEGILRNTLRILFKIGLKLLWMDLKWFWKGFLGPSCSFWKSQKFAQILLIFIDFREIFEEISRNPLWIFFKIGMQVYHMILQEFRRGFLCRTRGYQEKLKNRPNPWDFRGLSKYLRGNFEKSIADLFENSNKGILYHFAIIPKRNPQLEFWFSRKIKNSSKILEFSWIFPSFSRKF